MIWGAQWHSRNKLDGDVKHLIFKDRLPVLFLTRRETRKFINEHYGYIKTRPDLRQEPHGWRLPTAVKVKVEVAVK